MKLLNLKIFPLFVFILYYSISAQTDLFQKISEMKNAVSDSCITTHIKTLEYAGGYYSRVNFTPGNDSAAAYIKKIFESYPGLDSVELDTFYIDSASEPYKSKPIVNVIATINGTVHPSSSLIIGAHYDCSASRMGSSTWKNSWDTIKAPGADDNATGVAGILEIGRILSDSVFNFISDYTIKLIAFGAEESGPKYDGSHHGSLHYAKNARVANESILGMVSVDMIGYNPNYNFTSIASNNSSKSVGNKFVTTNDIFSVGLEINHITDSGIYYSDHDSFWDYGYKAILLIENTPPWEHNAFYSKNPFYHKTSDTFETLNIELVKKVTQLTLAAAASISVGLTDVEAQDEIIPDFILSQNFPNPFNSSTIIEFTIPDSEGSSSLVYLKVFDILGNEVASLINEEKPTGIYQVKFEAGNLSSGIYFYRLDLSNKKFSISETKKIILLK